MPAVVGVPLITPVVVFKLIPGGSCNAVYDVAPPEDVIWYCVLSPTIPCFVPAVIVGTDPPTVCDTLVANTFIQPLDP